MRTKAKKIVTPCPHCHNTLKNEYPQFGGHYEVQHHSALLAELLQSGRLGHEISPAQRKAWPVIESAGQIVWMRSFPASQDFASNSGDAVLIEEITMSAEAAE